MIIVMNFKIIKYCSDNRHGFFFFFYVYNFQIILKSFALSVQKGKNQRWISEVFIATIY